MKPYLVVAGDFVRTGGMDVANHALATALAERGHPVHLVTHRAEAELAAHPNVEVHLVPRPAGSHLLAAPLLDRAGRMWAARVAARGGRVVVNGGNCRWADVNWVHYVHAAYEPAVNGSAAARMRRRWAHRHNVRREREIVPAAARVIANSERTRRELEERVGVDAGRARVVYYGVDPLRFAPATAAVRAATRRSLGWDARRPVVAFVGGLGDRRKGFDVLFAAWRELCRDPRWDADLAVIGTGAELPRWRAAAAGEGLAGRIHFLGFRDDVPRVLGACDALAAPTRYEAYGLGVHEALCCGIPALVSADAGVAERYPAELRELLIGDAGDAVALAARIRLWRDGADALAAAALAFSDTLRARTWAGMAGEMMEIFDGEAR